MTTPIASQVFSGVNLQYQGWATIDTLDGTNVYMVSSVRTAHVDPYGAVGFSKSTDGGKTWSQYKIIVDTPLDDRDSGIVDLGNGHLAVVWFTRQAADYQPDGTLYNGWLNGGVTEDQRLAVQNKYAELEAAGGKTNKDPFATVLQGSYMIHSYDYGETWETESIVTIGAFAPHGPTRMNDGGLVYLGMAWNSTKNPSGGRRLYVYMSQDEGRTWKLSGIMMTPEDSGIPTESHIIQLDNGIFVGTYRVDGEDGLETWMAYSKDGKTWNEEFTIEYNGQKLNYPADPVKLTNLVGGPPHLLELKNGVLVLTYGYRVNPQCGVRARFSYDYGKTWGRETTIETSETPSNGDLGYPVTVELADGTLLTAYYQQKGNDGYCSVLMTRWTVTDPNKK